MKLDKRDRMPILEAVLEGNVDQAKANVKGNNSSGGDGGGGKIHKMTIGLFRSAVKALFVGDSDMENMWDDVFQRATDAARKVTDSQFLTRLGEDLERFAQFGHLLEPLADRAKERAFEHLEGGIAKTMKKLTPAIHSIQEQDCTERIKRDQASRAEEEQRKLRLILVRQVNNLSAHTAHTQVLTIFLSNEC